jgi:predicted nucleic acid-binding protein
MANLVVVYDACILYSAPIRDLFMRLALRDIYSAKWTKDIHKEWITSLLKKRPDLTKEQLEKTRKKMDMHVRDCIVGDYEKLIEKLVLPDSNDRHVLAAAICASAQIIVTFNVSDFPLKSTKKYGVEAQHPDRFLCHLLDIMPLTIIETVKETRLSLKNPPKSAIEYLVILEQQSLPLTVKYLREHIDLI